MHEREVDSGGRGGHDEWSWDLLSVAPQWRYASTPSVRRLLRCYRADTREFIREYASFGRRARDLSLS